MLKKIKKADLKYRPFKMKRALGGVDPPLTTGRHQPNPSARVIFSFILLYNKVYENSIPQKLF